MNAANPPFLYRIVSFTTLIDLFKTRSLYFSSPKAWLDPFENTFQHRNSNNIFGQCWCKKATSDAMWRIYSPEATAVRIKTSRSALRSTLRKAAKDAAAHCFIDDVKYLSASKVTAEFLRLRQALQSQFDLSTAAQGIFLKRDAFDHEAEVRVILHADESLVLTKNERRYIRLPVDPHSLVLSVLFDPRADESYVEVCKYYLQSALQFRGPILKSQLYRVREGIVAEWHCDVP
jgi:hypothetical protein